MNDFLKIPSNLDPGFSRTESPLPGAAKKVTPVESSHSVRPIQSEEQPSKNPASPKEHPDEKEKDNEGQPSFESLLGERLGSLPPITGGRVDVKEGKRPESLDKLIGRNVDRKA